jgi:predicted ArsR family transcriptional regulator
MPGPKSEARPLPAAHEAGAPPAPPAPAAPAVPRVAGGSPPVSASALRREILLRLRQSGPTSPDQLARLLGASRTGVLQQLRALEAAELVSRQTFRHGVGRPRHLYDVTPAAQELFPTNYDGLATGLLAAVHAMGGEQLIEDLFAARRRQLGERMQQRLAERLGPDASLGETVRELAVFQDEQGYLCRAVDGGDDVAWLQEFNCAIHHVARETPAACAAELELFREVLNANVVRESHIAVGDRCCSYRIEGRRTRPD